MAQISYTKFGWKIKIEKEELKKFDLKGESEGLSLAAVNQKRELSVDIHRLLSINCNIQS